MKETPLNKTTITYDQMLKLFQELKDEILDKDKRFIDFKERPSLNFYDHDGPMSDQNYYVLRGLTTDQF